MNHKRLSCIVALLIVLAGICFIQAAEEAKNTETPKPPVLSSRDIVLNCTPNWTGPRMEDGRPIVPDEIIKRMKDVSIVEAWSALNREYPCCYTTGKGWIVMRPDQTIVGRVLTAQYMPTHPDYNRAIVAQGEAEGRTPNTGSNTWPIEVLKKGDVYVADGYGKINEGTLIGDNLANSIYANSGNGVIFDAAIRDYEGIQEIEGFNMWFKAAHPSGIRNMMLTGINVPIRIGDAVACPGDIVLAKSEGIVFIPPHLAERVVTQSERTRLRDMFGHQRLKEGKYTSGQIDTGWSAEIRADYRSWLKENMDKLSVPKAVIQSVLEEEESRGQRGAEQPAEEGQRRGRSGRRGATGQ